MTRHTHARETNHESVHQAAVCRIGIILSSIEEELRNAGKHVIITAGHSEPERERSSIEFLLSRRCDALILHAYALDDEYLRNLVKGPVPVVLLTRTLPEISNRCFTLDNVLGGYLAAQAVIEDGHRKIAYITGPLWKMDARDRLEGHKRALAEAGISFDEELTYEGTYQESSGNQGMVELLNRGNPFTAVVCANDEMAAGAMDVARKQGFNIPDDMSVIGFDNVYFTRYLHPKLSSISYSIDGMGRMAARCVLKEVYGESELDIQNEFIPSLVRRESTTAPN